MRNTMELERLLDKGNVLAKKGIILKKRKKHMLLHFLLPLPIFSWYMFAKASVCQDVINMIDNKKASVLYRGYRMIFNVLTLGIFMRMYTKILSDETKLQKTLGLEY